MRKIKAKELTKEDFSKYGTFVNLFKPEEGEARPDGFFQDLFILDMPEGSTAHYCTVRVRKRPFIVDTMETHQLSGEVIIPLDGDVYVQVAPATSPEEFPTDEVEVFKVPCGTAVAVNRRVWHFAPFAMNSDCVNAMIIQNIKCNKDFAFHTIPEDERIEFE